jgi:hypothetical protein
MQEYRLGWILEPGVLFNQLGDQTRPAGLVGSAETGPVVAMEILKEEHMVLPVRVLLERPRTAIHRSHRACIRLVWLRPLLKQAD